MAAKRVITGPLREWTLSRAVEGWPTTSIARVLGVSVSAVYSALQPEVDPAKPQGFYQRVVDGRCCHCGSKVVGRSCLACELRHSLV